MSSILYTGYFIRASIEKLLMPALGMDREERPGDTGEDEEVTDG